MLYRSPWQLHQFADLDLNCLLFLEWSRQVEFHSALCFDLNLYCWAQSTCLLWVSKLSIMFFSYFFRLLCSRFFLSLILIEIGKTWWKDNLYFNCQHFQWSSIPPSRHCSLWCSLTNKGGISSKPWAFFEA